MEIALKYKGKQSKNGTVTQKYLYLQARELLRVPSDCSQKVSQFIAVCVGSLFTLDEVHTGKALEWLSFRNAYVLKASFGKNFLQITDINFLPTI